MPASNPTLKARASFYIKDLIILNPNLIKGIEILLAFSDFALRQREILKKLLREDDCLQNYNLGDYLRLVDEIQVEDLSLFQQAIRHFRHYHLLRLLVRELSGLASTEDSLKAWSYCAEALILKTLNFSLNHFSKIHGLALSKDQNKTELYAIAMGKLGGEELNYSSDIDLIFAFSESGSTAGPEVISNQEYYTKVIQLFVKLMQEITVDGFVFRVDLRLRPNGDSGALVSSLFSLETYYQEQGRDWERYAMVKARLLGSAFLRDKNWIESLISPFVYRRYVDFSVIESLRSMKSMIEREVKLNPQLNDIKRGLGGIREIEFIVQSIQLIRGGRIKSLKETSTLKALSALSDTKLLNKVPTLEKAYLFLRKLENLLQSQNEEQTHSLPKDDFKKEQIAFAMGFKDKNNLEKRLQQYQRIIRFSFHSILYKSDFYEDNQRSMANQLLNLWQGHIEKGMAIHLLSSMNFKEPERCYNLLQAFRHGPRCRRLSQSARMRLDSFMVLLLNELQSIYEAHSVLLEVLRLLENIVGRSAYLALLTENPSVLKELIYWFQHNPYISSMIVNQPFLLENLLEEVHTHSLPSKKELTKILSDKLKDCQDKELEDEILRQFKLTYWLLAARTEMFGQYNALRIGRFLADVTDVIIREVLNLSCRELEKKHSIVEQIKKDLAVIAYGKLGSREMNYDSDLDLVFLHASILEDEMLITRLTQKILHRLNTRSQLGILYTVDTRLRPSGSSGLLITNIDAFINYQQNNAWTWEHQALLRARPIVANKILKKRFSLLKEKILFLPRKIEVLKQDVISMRLKIGSYNDPNQIKYAEGGLLDLEFLTQYLILANPRNSFVSYTNTQSLLEHLAEEGVINKNELLKLKNAYRHYHQLLHLQLLKPGSKDYHLPYADALVIKSIYERYLR